MRRDGSHLILGAQIGVSLPADFGQHVVVAFAVVAIVVHLYAVGIGAAVQVREAGIANTNE